MSVRARIIVALVLLAAAAWLYGRRLGDAPIYLTPDEATIAVDAHALATTGRDVTGERLPLYFRIQVPGEERYGWFMPVIFYASALVMKVAPFNEATVRLPSVIVALVDLLLVFLVARRVFRSGPLAGLAAVVLALTPAHLILSRYTLDYLYPVPFVLGWLLCLLTFLEHEDRRRLFAATLLLGLGFYSYISSVLMMPVYLLLTLLVLSQRRDPVRTSLVAVAGFALPLAPLVPWLLRHPGAFGQTAQRYDLYDARKLNALQGLREFLSYPNVERLASLYWSFLSPGFLFFSGDGQIPFSTRAVGVFLLPLIVLIPAGIYEALRRRTAVDLLVLAGFVMAPAAAVLVPEPGAIIRAATMLPFGALLAVYGVQGLWRTTFVARARAILGPAGAAIVAVAAIYAVKTLASESRVTKMTLLLIVAGAALVWASRIADRVGQGRIAAVLLLALLPFQFAGFYRDYFGDYRLRSSSWLSGNVRGALETLIAREARDHAPFVYFARLRSTSGLLDTRNRWMDAYWRFYLIKHGREDLLARSRNIDTNDVSFMPPGSLVLANDGDQVAAALVGSGQLKRVETIPEVDGQSFFVILRR